MANILNNNASTLTNQQGVKSMMREIGAEDLYLKDVTKQGQPVTYEDGTQMVCFMLAKGEKILLRGLVSRRTVEDGPDASRLQVAESHYNDKQTGEPKTCWLLFNGVDQLEGATKFEL